MENLFKSRKPVKKNQVPFHFVYSVCMLVVVQFIFFSLIAVFSFYFYFLSYSFFFYWIELADLFIFWFYFYVLLENLLDLRKHNPYRSYLLFDSFNLIAFFINQSDIGYYIYALVAVGRFSFRFYVLHSWNIFHHNIYLQSFCNCVSVCDGTENNCLLLFSDQLSGVKEFVQQNVYDNW